MQDDEDQNNSPPSAPNQLVFFPAYTYDYRVTNGVLGFGIAANRKFKKGELLFDDSLDFTFTDVMDGDKLLFDGHRKASKKCVTGKGVPPYFSLTRETLLRTHGIPSLEEDPTEKTAGDVGWRLEVPGMLMNHSCDPNTIDYPQCHERGEAYAARDIQKGEEFTCDYVRQYYNHGPFFDTCHCGAENCRGEMNGFKALSDVEKERLFPVVSRAVQAMHLADIGEGLSVTEKQTVFPPRRVTRGVTRLVYPGPSCALANVIVKRDDEDENAIETNGDFALHALKDYNVGERVYEMWCQPWPALVPEHFDMVLAAQNSEGDPPEGTVIRVDASRLAPGRHRNGPRKFSGWDMLTRHSCDPNITYNDDDSDDEEEWRGAHALKFIGRGDRITVDYNRLSWDRTKEIGDDPDHTCCCGAGNCTGTVKGFKFIPKEAQLERKSMAWKVGREKVTPGEALAAYVRMSWRNDPLLYEDAPMTGSSGSSSSEDSSTDESDVDH